jgi:type I restriction enzyme S subunit
VKSVKSVVKSLSGNDTESATDLPDRWQDAPFSAFIESSFYGPRFGKESYATEGVPTIRTTDMGFDGSISLTDALRIKLSREELDKYCLQHGDLVVTRTGATIGKCAVYDKSRGPAIPGAYLIRFRFKQDLVVPTYILRFFMSPAGQNLLVGGSNAVAQSNVNATTISQFLIQVPPSPEQQEIVRRVKGLFALADQIEARLAAAQRHVDSLTPSLLARAFAGKLVPQDPADEPAEKLLARIRKEEPRITRMPRMKKGKENP